MSNFKTFVCVMEFTYYLVLTLEEEF